MNDASNPQPTATDEAIELSRRVRSIQSIVQLRGRFEYQAERTVDRLFPTLLERPARARLDGTSARVTLDFLFEAWETESQRDAGNDSPVIVVDAEFLVQYEMADGEVVSEAGLQAFGEINGRFNLTPYWREYLTACLGRAGLPPFVVPPLNAVKRIAAAKRRESTVVQPDAQVEEAGD
jgi:hypothetical protein